MSGDPPFQSLSLLGDSGKQNLMRGYYRGRYRDKNIIVFQTEYRIPLWWRFGAVAFIGVGNVASAFDMFKIKTVKYSYGAGLRFQLDDKEKINLRIDIGFGKETSGFYFTIGEAF